MRTYEAASLGSEGAEAAVTPSLTQFISLSNYAYTSGKTIFSPTLEKELGYEPLKVNGKVVARYDQAKGFYGEAFISTGSGPKSVIVAFEGTNIHNPPSSTFEKAQISADVDIFDGKAAPSFTDALQFTRRAMKAAHGAGVSKGDIFLTGHSLGAAQAEYAASYTGLGGATFGTPGLSTAIIGNKDSELQDYVDQGDPVGNYAANPPRYMGSIVQSSSIEHFGSTHLVGDSWHSALLTEAAKLYAKNTFEDDIATAIVLGEAAKYFHPLANYAHDLHATLYGSDRTQDSGSEFFAPIDPLSHLLGATLADQHAHVSAEHAHVAGFGGGGFFGHHG